MLEFLIGTLIYVVIAACFFCYCIVCDNILAKKGLQPKIPLEGWENHDFYIFLSFIWIFLMIFLIYGKIKEFYVKYIW
jgi:hypothetical protein